MGSCTWTDSLVCYWLSAADDDCLRERLHLCLNSSHSDVTLACLNWIESSCDIAKYSEDTQLLLQASNFTLDRVILFMFFYAYNIYVIARFSLFLYLYLKFTEHYTDI